MEEGELTSARDNRYPGDRREQFSHSLFSFVLILRYVKDRILEVYQPASSPFHQSLLWSLCARKSFNSPPPHFALGSQIKILEIGE